MRLVYLSPVPWSSFAQRPHKFVEWFQARAGSEVLWVDPYPARFPALTDFRRMLVFPRSENPSEPNWLKLLKLRVLPIEPIPVVSRINQVLWRQVHKDIREFCNKGPTVLVVGKPSRFALQILRDADKFVSTIYDAMDDFSAFHAGLSGRVMARTEDSVVERVDELMVSSTALMHKWRSRKVAQLARNACAIEMLPTVPTIQIQTRPRVLGYVGTMSSWFDWRLVYALARTRPELTVRLVGPLHTNPPENMPANIEILPPCSHAQAIDVMQSFGAGLIPFVSNLLTNSVDPIKYYEYRALGLPVLSTVFGEMRFHARDPGVFKVAPGVDFGGVIDQALAHQEDLREITSFRARNNWSGRFDSLNWPYF